MTLGNEHPLALQHMDTQVKSAKRQSYWDQLESREDGTGEKGILHLQRSLTSLYFPTWALFIYKVSVPEIRPASKQRKWGKMPETVSKFFPELLQLPTSL